jgi:hypothetical protein
VVSLLPGSIDAKDWLRKSAEEDDVVTKGDARKPLGSECSNEWPGPPAKVVGYSDEGVEKEWTEGGGVADE